MKIAIIAIASIVSTSALAATKTVTVCYGDSSKGNLQCKQMTYDYFGPKSMPYSMKEGNGSKVTSFNRKVIGNWKSRPFNKEERRLDEKNNGGSNR